MSEKEKLTMEMNQRLGHYSTLCPYCGKTIYMPRYRLYPRTYEEARRLDRIMAKAIIEEIKNE